MAPPETSISGTVPVATLVRELTTAYQAIQSCEAHHLKRYRLTPAQADVLCALGCRPGMSCRELAETALVSRGSLTGILERLERRGLLCRTPSREDRRVMMVRLTESGEEVLAKIEPSRMTELAQRFDRLDARKQTRIVNALKELRHALV